MPGRTGQVGWDFVIKLACPRNRSRGPSGGRFHQAGITAIWRFRAWPVSHRDVAAYTAVDKAESLIVDNYATHKNPRVRAWPAKHPRFHLHFTPTSAAWTNLVERFLRD